MRGCDWSKVIQWASMTRDTSPDTSLTLLTALAHWHLKTNRPWELSEEGDVTETLVNL